MNHRILKCLFQTCFLFSLGYILGPSDQMEKERLIGIREINSLGVVVLRFVLHVSLRSHFHTTNFSVILFFI